MATNFPTSIQALDDPIDGDVIDAADADTVNDTVEALQRRAFRAPLTYSTVGAATRTARSFAHKAGIFTPSANMTLYGVRYYGPIPALAITVKGEVFTVSAGAIATITQSSEFTNTNGLSITGFLDLMFAAGVSLTAGTPYGLGAGYSTTAGGGSATGDFPVFVCSRDQMAAQMPFPGTWASSVYHIASLTPIVSTAVTTSANDQSSGFATYAVFPIFDWA